MYLRDNDRDYSVRDIVFSLSNRTLDAKYVSKPIKASKGQKPSAARALTEKKSDVGEGTAGISLSQKSTAVFILINFYQMFWS